MKKITAFPFLMSLLLVSCANPTISSQESFSSSEPSLYESYRSAADKVKYDFDPTSVKSPEYCIKDGNSYRAMNQDEILEKSKLTPSFDSDEMNVYAEFEGTFREGFNGVYATYTAKFRLFENGTMALDVYSQHNVKSGVWFNDVPYKQNGQDVLGIKLEYINNNNLVVIDCLPSLDYPGCYTGKVDIKTSDNVKRTIVLLGYIYYPTVGLYIDDRGNNEFTIAKNQNASYVINGIRDNWQPYFVLKNLVAYPFVDFEEEITYSISGCDKEGTKTVVANYQNFYFTRDIELYII